MILRLVWKHVEKLGERAVRAGLLGGEFKVEEYRVARFIMLAQDPAMVEVHPLPDGAMLAFAPEPWEEYCRWHSGPIDRPDNPLERLYCNVPASGYCRQHKRSDRAIYEMCMSLRSDKGLAACRELDRRARTEYVVYMTDFGGPKPKVGVTRRFRILERLAEQVHVTATVLATVDSAFEARRIEMKLSRMGLAQEVHRRVLHRGLRPVGESVARISYWAERASKAIGEPWSSPILRIVPPGSAGEFVQAASIKSIEGFRVEWYWGGLLGVTSTNGRKIAVPARRLQHKDSILILEAESS